MNTLALRNSRNTRKTLRAFDDGAVTGDFLPSYYGIELTRHCNLACVMCPHPSYGPGEKGHMAPALFRQIIEQIAPYAELVRLHWVGEPLMHPNAVELIKYARAHLSAALHLSTNATLLAGDLAEQIRTAGLDKIILSLDGMSPESYEKVRVKGHFARTFRNIENFLENVERHGGPLCDVQMIVTKRNEHEIAQFKEYWGRFRCAAVNVTWLTDWAGNIPNRDSISTASNPVSSAKRSPCSDLWFKMQFAWSGEINLCCLDAKRSVVLGKIQDASLREIWHSDLIRSIRRQHLEQSYCGLCRDCHDWAKPQEYEFWYTRAEYQRDPNMIWSAPNLTSTIQ